jgi:hypothetical protein
MRAFRRSPHRLMRHDTLISNGVKLSTKAGSAFEKI